MTNICRKKINIVKDYTKIADLIQRVTSGKSTEKFVFDNITTVTAKLKVFRRL